MQSSRGHEALRRHRVSVAGAHYFLTLCCEPRIPVLTATTAVSAIRQEITAIEPDDHWIVRGAVVMPDHVHLLITLGDSLPLGKAVARLKSKTRRNLLIQGVKWQDNYFEHRLRPEDSIEAVLRYLHLNPYRSKLLETVQVYPHFWLGAEEQSWFTPQLDDDRPLAEWLRD